MKKNTINRAINRLYTSLVRKIKENSVSEGSIKLKYLLFKSTSNNLIVCFPAFADKGAKYNYVHTMREFNATKLFFLDDFGENHRGSYLLGEVESLVIKVIKKVVDDNNPQRIMFVGSSKGGYSALYYSLFFNNVSVCIAAPQYLLGNYLDCEVMKPSLNAILGKDITPQKLEDLNKKLSNGILHSPIRPRKIYLHFSDREHTYREHIIFLLQDIEKVGIPIETDICHYAEHTELVSFYPNYLKNTLKRFLES